MEKEKVDNKAYSSPIGMTQQFRFCGNPFRVDMYKGCDFGCKYCFANSSLAKGREGICEAKFTQIENLFTKAFDEDDETNNLTVELLRHRVPLHCGGMSDPFQTREWEMGLTKKLIQLSNKYNYPISFSTKAAALPEEYYEILNPEIHTFQISIMGFDDEYIRKYESNTPTAKERVEFLRELRKRGFWCSVRIQPLVDIEQVEKLLNYMQGAPSYITVEHLKIPVENVKVRELFLDEYNEFKFYKTKNNMRNIEPHPSVKIENIARVKELAGKYGVPVGVGDNDFHHLSQSRCCCGVDTMPESFQNYLKYNLTYFVTGESCPNELYCPECNCRDIFNSRVHKGERFLGYERMVKEYILKNEELVEKTEHKDVTSKLFGRQKKKLF